MEYKIVLEPDQEDGGYVVHCPALPGCYSQGYTREEAIDNIREAIEAYIESLKIDNLPVPPAVDPEIASVRVRAYAADHPGEDLSAFRFAFEVTSASRTTGSQD